MNRAWRQLRVLHREFLFRVVDRELLSTHAQGDMSKLLIQFAALLIFVSLAFVAMAQSLENELRPQMRIVLGWMNVHRLVAATMLVVGLFAVLSWQSMFPDRQDVHVLGPLPVRPRTMLLAKVAAIITALLTTVLALHLAAGIAWPFVLNLPAEVQTIPALISDRPLPPVGVTDLKAVMDRDLADALKNGVLAPGAGGGIAIGIYRRGERQIFAYGAATPNSMFEAGSATKTFTGTLLAHLVGQGLTRLDAPVRELISDAGIQHRPGGDGEITLLDLATHRSSLRAMDLTVKPEDPDNPFADYTKDRLYIYLRARGLRKYANFGFIYSNLGMGLLGHALATRANTSYVPMAKKVIIDALSMHDTVMTLNDEQKRRFMRPYAVGFGPRHPVRPYDVDVLAGAGGFRSTAGDMLTWAEANLHPDQLSPGVGAASAALAAAMVDAHEPREKVGANGRIGLAWFIDPATGRHFHGGATPGTTTEVSFNPREDTAMVVMSNTGPGSAFSADILAEHIRARLAGTTPIALADMTIPAAGSMPRLLRFAAAWWLTMIAAGAFIFCLVMSIQGVALQLLPRRLFLRASSFLQIGAFAAIVSVYCLQPGASPLALIAAQQPLSDMTGLVPWSPSFWFLGLFQQLSGSPAFPMLATRAWVALGIVVTLTATVYAFSYFRTLRRIAEEATIVPSTRAARARWLPAFVGGGGGGLSAAIVPFSVRTLLRSPQHRVILAFYLGMGFAAAIFFMNLSAPPPIVDQTAATVAMAAADRPWHEESGWLLASSILMLAFSVLGARLAFALPLDLRANWIFRIMPTREGREYLVSRRRAMLAVGVLPVWAVFAVLLLSAWPWLPAIGHLIVLGLLGAILTELGLRGVQKIPFTCSYLPGKSAFHVSFWVFFLIGVPIALKASSLEQEALQDPAGFAGMLSVFAIVLIALRWWNWRAANSGETEPRFEEELPGQMLSLNVWDSQIQSGRLAGGGGERLPTPSPSSGRAV